MSVATREFHDEDLALLYGFITSGNVEGAIALLEKLDELSRKSTIRIIKIHMVVLLVHLIKQQAEGRTTKSWECSIANAVADIQWENQRSSGSTYLTVEELEAIFLRAWPTALRHAAIEVDAGIHSDRELDLIVGRDVIRLRALSLVEGGLG